MNTTVSGTQFRPPRPQRSQVATRQRVRDLAEVHTDDREVNTMLDLVPEMFDADGLTKTCLEPACGTGNFLVALLARKLAAGDGTESTRLAALRSLRAVDIDLGNVQTTRLRLLEGVGVGTGTPHFFNAAQAIVEANVVRADFMADEPFRDIDFDLIVGNPPYQVDNKRPGGGAAPIYHQFVEAAIGRRPSRVLMIIPSRWFSAGEKTLAGFRRDMLADRHIRALIDYPKLRECFPEVKVRGGVCILLWDRDHDGAAEVRTIWDGQPLGPPTRRPMDEFGDVFVRQNGAVPILRKVRQASEPTCSEMVAPVRPFGLDTSYVGDQMARISDPVLVHGMRRITWTERSSIAKNTTWIDRWKVLIPAASDGEPYYPLPIFPLSNGPFVAGPGEVCTMTYLVAGCFGDEHEAVHFANYLRTKFVRFLVHLRKPTQHNKADVFAFVPRLPMYRTWNDDDLFDRYGIDEDERAFIDATVRRLDQLPPAPRTTYRRRRRIEFDPRPGRFLRTT